MVLSDTRKKQKAERIGAAVSSLAAFFTLGRVFEMADYKALYRKWRPFDFDDVCGQRAITDILKYEVANDKVSHAYLFCGSRGTGKTSCAKILAKAVNCLNPHGGNPCNECEACRSIDKGTATDVIEMDAASNNGVDNVRILKDEISFTPASLKYRVYIIDEVHMMSTQAFNALLKTLEEPPSYVVFILATTEYNKLPTTIVSRCQRFDFRRIGSDVIVDRLMKISEKEGIDLVAEGARLIARAARGGMRDAISLLELCAGSREKIDARLVTDTIGSGDRDAVYKLISALACSDYSTVYKTVDDVVSGSADISVFWLELIETYRDIMVVKNSDIAKEYLDLTEVEFQALSSIAKRFTMAKLSYHATLLEAALADMLRSQNSKRSIAEIALTRMCDAKLVASPESLALRIEELEKQLSLLKMGAVSQAMTETEPSAVEKETVAHEEAEEILKADTVDEAYGEYNGWDAVVERINELKPPLAAGLRKASAVSLGNNSYSITLDTFFASRLAKSSQDLTLLRGVISEHEGIDPISVHIQLKTVNGEQLSAIDEIENALK